MQKKIHPQFYPDAKVTCACGNTFTTGSTQPEIKVEICNLCHPFFTGQMKYIDTMGRVEKFQKKQQAAGKYVSKKAKQKSQQKQDDTKPTTLKEMIQMEKKKAQAKQTKKSAKGK